MLLNDDVGQTQIAPVNKPDSPELFLHCAIFLIGDRVLSDETFRLVALQGEESVSEPFEFQLTLHGNSEMPQKNAIRFSDIIGRRVTFAVQRPYTKDIVADQESSFERFKKALEGKEIPPGLALYNGIAAGFGMQEPGVYRLTVKPALWKLMLTNRYRIYAQQTIVGAIKQIFQHYPDINVSFARVSDPRSIALARTQDWMQAGETDYEFVQRLMAKAHLYYYFEHGPISHILKFANTVDYPEACPGQPLRYTSTSAEPLGAEYSNAITQYSYEQTLTHTGVQSMFVREQSAWECDPLPQLETFPPLDTKDAGELAFRLYKIYQYGGSRSMTSDYAKATADAIRASAIQFSGASHCALLRTGYKFQVVEDPPAEDPTKRSNPIPVSPTLDKQWFVLTQIKHEASLDGDYTNEFTATDATALIASVSVHDTHQGSVLAKVVKAENSQSVAPDNWKYYLKSNFDIGSLTATDTVSDTPITNLTGVYVRFSSDGENGPKVWVKLASHMQTAPEIGTNVIVARSSDESEMPEIQAIVQSNGQFTVKPNEHWIADTRVGRNYNTSYSDAKNIRFGFDKGSKAELQTAIDKLNLEYETKNADGTRLFHELGYTKGARYSYETSEQGKDGTLSKNESYGSTYSHAEGKERKSYEDIGYTRSEQKIGSSDSYETVTGKRYSESTLGELKSYETVKGNRYSKSHVDGVSHSVSEVPFKEINTSRVGISNRNSAIGLSNENSIVGFSENNHVVGTSTDIRAAINTNQVNVTGVTTEVNASGLLVRVSGAIAHAYFENMGKDLRVKTKPGGISVKTSGVEIEMATIIKM
ncbi:MAG TPA: phage late control D family protein [Burkholderiales bacterium]|nr:phage late control D family protein [Burkholderiales bacterium]